MLCYHHYLQHPDHAMLMKTLKETMHLKVMHTSICKHICASKLYQTTKPKYIKHWKIPTMETVITLRKTAFTSCSSSYTIKDNGWNNLYFIYVQSFVPALAAIKGNSFITPNLLRQ